MAIEHTLLSKGLHTPWATVCETLATHQVCTVVLPAENGDVLTIRRAVTPVRCGAPAGLVRRVSATAR